MSAISKWMNGRTQRSVEKALAAEGIEITATAIGTWERGEVFPSADKWPAIAKVLGVTTTDIGKAAIAFAQKPAEATA